MVIADKLRKPSALAAASLLFVASLVPLLGQQTVNAYGLLGDRNIQLSSSVADATGVTYLVSFEVATGTPAGDFEGVVVDFCDSPIIGDTCNAPAGFTLASATVSNQTGITGFTESADPDNDANTLILTNSAAAQLNSGDPVTITVDDVENPTAVGTFYARILTFDTEANAENYTSTAAEGGTGAIDAGGVALSTAAQITITSKVQERLEFCVYTTGAGNNCTGKSGTAVTLGDDNGVLSTSGEFVDKNAKYSVTSNAVGDVAIRAKGSTLTSGTFTIDPIGGGTGPAVTNPGTEQFGFCTYESTAASDGSVFTAAANYSGLNGGSDCSSTTQTAGTGTPGGANGSQFGFITANLNSTYGDLIATKEAGDYSTGTLAFMGNISNTTEAGIYTTTMTFIATGTY